MQIFRVPWKLLKMCVWCDPRTFYVKAQLSRLCREVCHNYCIKTPELQQQPILPEQNRDVRLFHAEKCWNYFTTKLKVQKVTHTTLSMWRTLLKKGYTVLRQQNKLHRNCKSSSGSRGIKRILLSDLYIEQQPCFCARVLSVCVSVHGLILCFFQTLASVSSDSPSLFAPNRFCFLSSSDSPAHSARLTFQGFFFKQANPAECYQELFSREG